MFSALRSRWTSVEDGDDVRMGKGGDSLRLVLEALAAVGIGGERFGKDFDRDVTGETRIARAIDFSHPTRADGGDDFVRT